MKRKATFKIDLETKDAFLQHKDGRIEVLGKVSDLSIIPRSWWRKLLDRWQGVETVEFYIPEEEQPTVPLTREIEAHKK